MFNIFELSGLFVFEGGLQLSILVPRGGTAGLWFSREGSVPRLRL